MSKTMVNGQLVSIPEDEEKKRQDEAKKYNEERQKKRYQNDRKMAYPQIGDQLDYIFHHGVAKWKTDIVQPVKDKFPKP